MRLRGRLRNAGGATIVELDGDADLASAPSLVPLLNRAVAQAQQRVIVDLDGLAVLDDTALGLLVGAAATARRRQLAFELLSTNERVRDRLAETRVDQIVTVVDAVAIG
jgi:anti-sigma B factor antagonist